VFAGETLSRSPHQILVPTMAVFEERFRRPTPIDSGVRVHPVVGDDG
jgi:hypothetical protein